MNAKSQNHVFWETISAQMRQVMNTFAQTEIGTHFYLAGGTALALQLGHRRSFDLDFFSPTKDIPSIRQPLRDALEPFEPTLTDASWGNLVFLVNGVQVGFYGYGYPMAAPYKIVENVRLASVADIGLMKLDALLARASRKDFHDLYAISHTILSQPMSLRELLDLAPQKYPDIRDFETQVAKRLVFFNRAEAEEPLPLLEEVSWETVKTFFRQQAIALSQDWIRSENGENND
ncbi:MAG: nucleotidyl transferase AbiEii/AbiGii toxin family protein [Chloroflexota bacterium]|nr:nucleotidyl transferase AbiEii/AbiGii toxin family protein [Chloroflexota bacterium]